MKYTITNQFQGKILVTQQNYNHKPTDSEISMMKWNTMSVSNDMFSMLISNGYSYCPTNRKKENVKDSSFICIDIDGETTEMNEYVESLQYKPTIYYTTPSNGNVEKSIEKYHDDKHIYRFRLIYSLSTPTTDANDYLKAYKYILKQNSMGGETVDVRVANQYYNGSFGCEIHNTNYVYTLPEEYKLETLEVVKDKDKEKKVQPQKNTIPTTYSFTDDTFYKDFYNMTTNDFIEKYDNEFGVNIKIKSDYIDTPDDCPVVYLPENYLEVPRRYYWDSQLKVRSIKRWKDGEERHRKLFIAGLIIRKLNPEFNQELLVYALQKELLNSYEYSDGKFNQSYIINLSENLFKVDLDRELKEIKHPKFKVKDEYCYNNRVSKRSVVAQVRNSNMKEQTYSEIDLFYDPTLKINNKKITQKQWIEILKENGVEVSLSTFKRYLEEKGLTKKRFNKVETQEIEKGSSTKENNISNTYSFTDDTFSENEEEVEISYTIQSDQRGFRELCNKINYGECDYTEELNWFNKTA